MTEKRTETEQDQVVEADAVVDDADREPTADDLGLVLPEDPEEAVRYLLRKVQEAREEASSYLDDLKRVAADFDNYRRRATREIGEATQRAAERLVTELLPVLDTFDAALAFEPTTEAEEKLLAGMHRTREQLLTILNDQGLEIVPSVGEPFDPEIHEAVMAPNEGSGRLVVKEELRRGYRLKGRLVRPALVAVEYVDDADEADEDTQESDEQ
ncbi:MAG: nucleotide exchange factor GrpE [Actinomycetes bacterium]|nr:nucleotide exchange factor GrpE [Acidimicrobiia bacterium]